MGDALGDAAAQSALAERSSCGILNPTFPHAHARPSKGRPLTVICRKKAIPMNFMLQFRETPEERGKLLVSTQN